MNSYVEPQLQGVGLLLLQGAGLYVVENLLRYTKEFWPVLITSLVLAGVIFAVAFWGLWQSPQYKNLWFLGPFVVLFLTSSFDVLSVFHIWSKPYEFLMTEYFQVQDPHLHNIYILAFIYFDAIVLHVVNSIVLIRVNNGLNFRSLLLFSATGLSVMSAVFIYASISSSVTSLHTFTKFALPSVVPYFVVFLGLLQMPRDFSFQSIRDEDTRQNARILSAVSFALLTLTLLVYVAKSLVLLGVDNFLLDVVRTNDPALFLNDVAKTTPHSIIHLGLTLLIGVPTILICLYHHVERMKPVYLWEISVVQAGVFCWVQWFFLVTPLMSATPQSIQISGLNLIFWIINLIPVLASLVQLASVRLYKVERDSGTDERKTQ